MDRSIHLALIGDYDPEVKAHRAIPRALVLAAAQHGCEVEPRWWHTTKLTDVSVRLADYDALWCVQRVHTPARKER